MNVIATLPLAQGQRVVELRNVRAVSHQIVAHLRYGTPIKGFAWNFSPIKPRFHVFPPGPNAGDAPVEVWLKNVKAVFPLAPTPDLIACPANRCSRDPEP